MFDNITKNRTYNRVCVLGDPCYPFSPTSRSGTTPEARQVPQQCAAKNSHNVNQTIRLVVYNVHNKPSNMSKTKLSLAWNFVDKLFTNQLKYKQHFNSLLKCNVMNLVPCALQSQSAVTHRVCIPGPVFFIPGNRECTNVIPGIPGRPGITKCMVWRQYSQTALWATRTARHSLCIDSLPAAGGPSDDGYRIQWLMCKD